MSKVSLFRKVSIAARIANEHVGRNRTVGALMSGARATARSFGRAMHQLWLEVTGTVFLSIALFGAVEIVREYSKYSAGGRATAGRLAIAICFTLTFAWFGLSSFWRVRRKSQRP